MSICGSQSSLDNLGRISTVLIALLHLLDHKFTLTAIQVSSTQDSTTKNPSSCCCCCGSRRVGCPNGWISAHSSRVLAAVQVILPRAWICIPSSHSCPCCYLCSLAPGLLSEFEAWVQPVMNLLCIWLAPLSEPPSFFFISS